MTWGDVATLMIVGWQEPTAWEVERAARSLFGADIPEMEVGRHGLRYPLVQRGVRMRDDHGVAVMNTHHPDPLAELEGPMANSFFTLSKKRRDSRIFQAQDRATTR